MKATGTDKVLMALFVVVTDEELPAAVPVLLAAFPVADGFDEAVPDVPEVPEVSVKQSAL